MSNKKTTKDSLGDRMKGYESVPNLKLTRRMPLIIRLDGKAFHTFTKKCERPFDEQLANVMVSVTEFLVKNIQGCKLGYTQSDEISLLLTDYDELNTDSWFDKKVQKMTSISASMATMRFQQLLFSGAISPDKLVNYNAMFDARVFTLPKEEVTNYFVWRQQDAIRNSVQMLGQANFSHKQLQNKSCKIIKEMLIDEGKTPWNNIQTRYKRGVCVLREPQGIVSIDKEIPEFSEDRNYIDKQFIYVKMLIKNTIL